METPSADQSPPLTRRRFLRRVGLATAAGLVGISGATVSYGFWEASQISVCREDVVVRNLPDAFVGATIAVLTDFHHGPFVGIDFIKDAVKLAASLCPDAFALVGDFAHKGAQAAEQLPPCMDAVAKLEAPLGVYAVPGNHDMLHEGKLYRALVNATPIIDLTNRSVCLTRSGESLWLAGVDDFWWGKPSLRKALADIPTNSAIVLLCHNPDFVEQVPDARVSLVLSGHTHGGQVYLPCLGSPWAPTQYGDKYLHGLVQGPASPVFVSRGLGEAGVPVRLNSPPEINLLTLYAAS